MRRYSPPYYSPPRRGYGGRARSPPRRGHGGYGGRKEQNHGSLLVRNVPLNCRPDDLRVPFERFGPVRDVYLPKDYYTGEPRGFAFVQFVDPYDASEAQYHMNGQLFGGREITVVLAAENRKRPEEMRTRGPGYEARRSSHYGRSRSRSVSRSRSPRYPSSSRARQRSRSYSPAPRRRAEYSPSPERRHARSPHDRSPVRDEDHHVHNRSYSPEYEAGNRDEAGNGYIERAYDSNEGRGREGRGRWKSSPGRASAGSPPGSRSRSADLSPRRGSRK
ncbi:serine/arginine-rich SC35-like splicing factor SCL30 isoform X2 [Aristolochia californica]|uniref:serine/arginine-rich SC35-like splicing factor SCL30 isoform X2 n=1 Tax=Aristolochia californica TaxID=171875 RepID=UPI0035E32C4C